ncbi:MAG: FecR domain-containing protein, partial [Verrucomicrobiota bacterium]
MAAAAVASLMGMLFFPIHERVSVDSHFATLIQATDCQWQGQMSPREGEPLGKSVLQLKEGGALVRFSDGVEISLLAPSRFEISGPNTATLYDGELYFSNEMSDSGVRFSLSTPQGKLIDIGTSYSVRIGPDGAEEIHVDDGKVIRFDRHDREFMIEAGQAMRWLEKGQGKEVPFVGKPKAKDHRVVRETQEMLLAWHSFVDRQGSGFAQEWMPWGERGSGARVKGAFTSRGFQPAEHTVIAAPLKVPIDMSQNGVTYFSFLCSRENASMTPKNFYFAFRESRSPDHKAQFVVTPKRLTVGAHLLYDDDDSSGRSTMALALPP